MRSPCRNEFEKNLLRLGESVCSSVATTIERVLKHYHTLYDAYETECSTEVDLQSLATNTSTTEPRKGAMELKQFSICKPEFVRKLFSGDTDTLLECIQRLTRDHELLDNKVQELLRKKKKAPTTNTTGSCQSIKLGHRVTSLNFSPDATFIGISCRQQLIIYNTASQTLECKLNIDRRKTTAISFSPDGKYVAAGDSTNTVQVWDLRTREMLQRFEGHTNGITAVMFSPDSKLVASGSYDTTVKLWELGLSGPVASLNRHKGWVSAVSFDSTGEFIVSGSFDNKIIVWTVGRKSSRVLKGHVAVVNSVKFLPDGRVVSGSSDRTIKIWTEASDLPQQSVDAKEYVNSIEVLCDGAVLAVGGSSGKISLWDSVTWEITRIIQDKGGIISHLAVSRSSSILAYSRAGSNKVNLVYL